MSANTTSQKRINATSAKAIVKGCVFVMNQNNNQKNEELSDYITHATNTANEIFKLYGTKVALDAMAQYMVKKP